MTHKFQQKPNMALELLTTSRLGNDSTVAVLAGAWPDMLEEWGLREKLGDILSQQQIDWLTNASAPGRNEY